MPSEPQARRSRSARPAAGPAPASRLQTLIEQSPAVIYCSRASGNFPFTYVSQNALRVLGYTAEHMIGGAGFRSAHVHPDDAAQLATCLERVFTEGQRSCEYRFRVSDGSYRWLHDSVRLTRDARGEPLDVVGSLTDITSRKLEEQALQAGGAEQQELIGRMRAAHDQLLQSEKMAAIGQLAAGIAHEINNPVGFVNSNMGSLQNYVVTLFSVIDDYEQTVAAAPLLQARMAAIRERADLAYLKGDVTALVKESMYGLRRVKDIVQSLKDFSHVGETAWQVADLHDGLDSTLNIVGNELRHKATIVKHYGVLPPVKCMASQLNQVFMNLLINAGHAIAGNGTITIRTGTGDSGESVWVEIGDTGEGIAPEHLHRIFEPFFSTKPVGSGTGLGLSLSYGIVNQHGGSIAVDSAPGAGARFTIRLPVNLP